MSDPTGCSQLANFCLSSSSVPFMLSLNATMPGQALHFLDGFSSILVPTTLLLKGTMPRQVLLPLLGTHSGAMIAGTLSLQDTMSRQCGRNGRTPVRDCACARNKCEKGREFTVSVSQTHGCIDILDVHRLYD